MLPPRYAKFLWDPLAAGQANTGGNDFGCPARVCNGVSGVTAWSWPSQPFVRRYCLKVPVRSAQASFKAKHAHAPSWGKHSKVSARAQSHALACTCRLYARMPAMECLWLGRRRCLLARWKSACIIWHWESRIGVCACITCTHARTHAGKALVHIIVQE